MGLGSCSSRFMLDEQVCVQMCKTFEVRYHESQMWQTSHDVLTLPRCIRGDILSQVSAAFEHRHYRLVEHFGG